MKFLLDTNTCIALLNGRAAVEERMKRALPDEIALCAIVRSELLFGAHKSAKAEKNLARLAVFFGPFRSLPFDDAAADRAGEIRAGLERAGTSAPTTC